MSPQDEEFLARLLLTFRDEAKDHLDVIISGVISLEKIPKETQPASIEPVFRATHSLKGAARAVGLKEIETLCQHLESVFSKVRKEELFLGPSEFDLFHQVITALEGLLAGDKTIRTSTLIKDLKKTASSGQGREENTGKDTPEDADKPMVNAAPVQIPEDVPEKKEAPLPIIPKPIPHERDEPEQQQPVQKPGPATVRISEERITSLYASADDLLTLRFSAISRLSEISAVSSRLQSWRWNLMRVEGDIAKIGRLSVKEQAALDRVLTFIDGTRETIGACETELSQYIRSLTQDQHDMNSVITGLIDSIREIVLVPVSSLTDTVPRMVRDIAREEQKEVEIKITGSDIEIDRRILEAMRDPFVHILRNAIDHGIEAPNIRTGRGKPTKGLLTIDVSHSRAHHIIIRIADDGNGINPDTISKYVLSKGIATKDELDSYSADEIIRLVFRSGLSTSDSISTVSGRGLGLAIVQEKMTQVGGTIQMESVSEKGTAFILTLPVSLATFWGVLVYAENRPFFLPQQQVERVLIPVPEKSSTIEGRSVYTLDDQIIPISHLSSILGIGSSGAEGDTNKVLVIVSNHGRRTGFFVDRLAGAQEIVVRNLGPQLRRIRFVSGVAVLNNTLVIPVLSAEELVEALNGQSPETAVGDGRMQSLKRRYSILVAEDSITSRMLLKNILEGAGYDVETAVDGLDALMKLKTRPTDLVVSDVDMPRMNGFALTEKVRSEKKLADIPLILVTSLDSREDREHGISVGANAYIIKSSFDQTNLLEVIERLIVRGR